MGKRLFSWLWGVCLVETEYYPGTKVALRAYVVCAQLVLRYYRLVLLSSWTIEGFIAALCAECLHGFFLLPSSRSRQIFSIKFLKEPCQDEEVWTFPSPCLTLTFEVHSLLLFAMEAITKLQYSNCGQLYTNKTER